MATMTAWYKRRPAMKTTRSVKMGGVASSSGFVTRDAKGEPKTIDPVVQFHFYDITSEEADTSRVRCYVRMTPDEARDMGKRLIAGADSAEEATSENGTLAQVFAAEEDKKEEAARGRTCPDCGRPSASNATNLCAIAVMGRDCKVKHEGVA
jgi:hypothetical protein